jgi:WS/DGAT/MGAT family acyltransferase
LGALQRIPELLERREEVEDLVARLAQRASALGETLAVAFNPTPPVPFHGALGPTRRFEWRTLPMERVLALRTALGGTVNEIALACVASALRSLLIAEGVEVEGVTLRASVPVNRRAAADAGRGGNLVSLCTVDLPVGIGDPRERYARVRESSERAKSSSQAQGLEVLGDVAEWTTSALLGAAAKATMQARPFNLVVTNIAGPRRPLKVLGAPLLALAPVVNLFDSLGLGVALASYAGNLTFGCIADPHLVPDLAGFADALAAGFEELEKLAAPAIPEA